MQGLVRDAMREGALGVGSSLIYRRRSSPKPPSWSRSRRRAEFGGGYVSHIRNESYGIGKALDELITIARESGAHSESTT